VPIRRAIDLAAQVSDGLAKAHEAGIVHRDLKPDNIMVSKDGFAKILDFGIAKLQTPTGGSSPAETGLTQTGFIVGTPDYMSPEQASGKPLTFRSDQFSLGLILYEMLAGRRAFHKATAVQTLSAIIQDEAEPVENFNARVPVPLRWLVERCLSKEPEERYNSSRDLSRELKLMRERAGELLAASDTRTSTSRPAPAVSTATFASTAAGPAAASANPAPGVATAAAGEPGG
jgi:serine/threonine protein kinase